MKRITIECLALLSLAGLPACSEGIEPVPFQGIAGRVRFVGSPPDSTEWVRLAVFREVPRTTTDLLGFVAFSDQLPLVDSAASYAISLDPGVYRWIPVIWKRTGAPLGTESLRVIGWHSSDGPFAAPEPAPVISDTETSGVNIAADFEALLTVEEALARLSEGGG